MDISPFLPIYRKFGENVWKLIPERFGNLDGPFERLPPLKRGIFKNINDEQKKYISDEFFKLGFKTGFYKSRPQPSMKLLPLPYWHRGQVLWGV